MTQQFQKLSLKRKYIWSIITNLTKESWGDDILLKSEDIRESEEQISKDNDLLMVQDFIKEFQPIHQQAKLVQEQLECNSHILCRLKQKLKAHNILDEK